MGKKGQHDVKKKNVVEVAVQKKEADVNKVANIILHNTSDKNLKRPDFINELCQYKTKCCKCKTVIQKIRSLLDDISDIRENEVFGVCKHCRKANPAGNCRRCEFIVNKYLKNRMQQYEDRHSSFKTWLAKVRAILRALLEGETVCRHKMYQDNSTTELERVLQELKPPLSMREHEIGYFPSMESERMVTLENLSYSKDMLDELINKLKSESRRRYASDDSLYVSPSRTTNSCVCKYFMDKKIEERRSMEVLAKVSSAENQKAENVKQLSKASIKITSNKDKPFKEKAQKERKGKIPLEGQKKKETSPKAGKQPREDLSKRSKQTSEENLLLKLTKENQNMKIENKKKVKPEKIKKLPKIEDLPTLKIIEKAEIEEDKSESILECDDRKSALPKEMIKGSKVIPFDPRYNNEDTGSLKPMLYKVQAVSPQSAITGQVKSASKDSMTAIENLKGRMLKNNGKDSDENLVNGIIRYELSNQEFIDKVWTKLPTTKIMRRMNIYRMSPVNPKYAWFERHKYRKMMLYDTGEKLAEIDDDGRGRWYYKNGIVALDYYNAKELNAGQRYVIYSSGEEVGSGKPKPVTVLAAFDFLGNGVVYDHYGNERIKYNQSEGMVFDEKIAPAGRWKWHTLNEPPALQQVFINTYAKHRDTCIEKNLEHHNDNDPQKQPDTKILALELENFAKERAQKLLQKFRPFEIRMKALKVNEQFTLRIIDQANIYLIFRNSPTSLKLNLGMLLINTEIVDTDFTEVFEVATPYDRNPPRSQSVAEIQNTLKQAKQIGNVRNARHCLSVRSTTSKCSS